MIHVMQNADNRSIMLYFAIISLSLWSEFDKPIQGNYMYNLNELAFEAILENVKQLSNGNPFMKLAIDRVSYEYNREQYNDCLRHIDDENNQIAHLFNQISQRGGFITPYEQQELLRHIQLRSEYEVKSMKHFMAGGKDAGDLVNNLVSR